MVVESESRTGGCMAALVRRQRGRDGEDGDYGRRDMGDGDEDGEAMRCRIGNALEHGNCEEILSQHKSRESSLGQVL